MLIILVTYYSCLSIAFLELINFLRLYVISRVSCLLILDNQTVTDEERQEAEALYGKLKATKIAQKQNI